MCWVRELYAVYITGTVDICERSETELNYLGSSFPILTLLLTPQSLTTHSTWSHPGIFPLRHPNSTCLRQGTLSQSTAW